MTDDLGIVYANVRDEHDGLSAVGNGDTDDTAAIQAAIDTGLHVLIPRGELDPDTGEILPYVIGSRHRFDAPAVLRFNHPGQRVTFLSGARLEIVNDGGRIEITAERQTFFGLRITTGTEAVTKTRGAIPAPALLIRRANGLLLEDLHVECGTGATLVEIRDTVGVTIRNGYVYGGGMTALNTGIVFRAARDFVGVGMSIHQLCWGIVFEEGTTEGFSLIDSTVEANLEHMIWVKDGALVRGLNLDGVHMEPGTYYGASVFILVSAGGAVHGGYITGCELAGLWTAKAAAFASAQPLATPSPRPDLGLPPPGQARVFRIRGEWVGVNVSGCFHNAREESSAEETAVYELGSAAHVANSCDRFNAWQSVTVVTGPKAAMLPVIASEQEGEMTIQAAAIRVCATKIGFFSATPTARGTPFVVPYSTDRTLTATNARRVLARLILDLYTLGLINARADLGRPR